MDYNQHLDQWGKAGLLDEATVEAIQAFELQQRAPVGPARPSLAEVILYLGFTLAAAGVFTLLAENWEDLTSATRVICAGVPFLAAFSVGWVLARNHDPALVRGARAAWFLAVGLVFATVAITVHEWADTSASDAILAGAASAFGLALLLWGRTRSLPQLVGVAASMFVFAQSLGSLPPGFSAAVAGSVALAGAAGAILAVERRLVGPYPVASALFALVAAAGAYEAGIDGSLPWAEAMAVVVALGFGAAGLTRANLAYLTVGVGLAFLSLVSLVFEYFASDIGPPLALVVSGGLLVAAVLAFIPLRRVVRSALRRD